MEMIDAAVLPRGHRFPGVRPVLDEQGINDAVAPLNLRVVAIRDDCLYLDFTVPVEKITPAQIDELPELLNKALAKFIRSSHISRVSIG